MEGYERTYLFNPCKPHPPPLGDLLQERSLSIPMFEARIGKKPRRVIVPRLEVSSSDGIDIFLREVVHGVTLVLSTSPGFRPRSYPRLVVRILDRVRYQVDDLPGYCPFWYATFWGQSVAGETGSESGDCGFGLYVGF